jgi:CRP-like cAMP-binding protein
MSTPATSGAPELNRLVADMSAAGRASLLKLCRSTALARGDLLHDAHTTISTLYFPLDCAISLLAPLEGHAPLEVAVVGNEGVLGVPAVLGLRSSRLQAVVQGSGEALCISTVHLRGEMRRQPRLRQQIDRYIDGLMAHLTQTAACNASHTVEARCARSLLMARDRLQRDELELTHAMLAQMLGVRRVGVTVAAGNLQRQGAIAYSRGRIVIVDPVLLGAAACECYGVIKNIYDAEALLG